MVIQSDMGTASVLFYIDKDDGVAHYDTQEAIAGTSTSRALQSLEKPWVLEGKVLNYGYTKSAVK
jgi:hypothetical protein